MSTETNPVFSPKFASLVQGPQFGEKCVLTWTATGINAVVNYFLSLLMLMWMIRMGREPAKLTFATSLIQAVCFSKQSKNKDKSLEDLRLA